MCNGIPPSRNFQCNKAMLLEKDVGEGSMRLVIFPIELYRLRMSSSSMNIVGIEDSGMVIARTDDWLTNESIAIFHTLN